MASTSTGVFMGDGRQIIYLDKIFVEKIHLVLYEIKIITRVSSLKAISIIKYTFFC